MDEHHTALSSVQLVYVGDGNNVAHSLLAAGALAGMHVRVICPKGDAPKAEVLRLCAPVAQASGSRLEVTEALMHGVRGADAIYTDVWTSMGQEDEKPADALILPATACAPRSWPKPTKMPFCCTAGRPIGVKKSTQP